MTTVLFRADADNRRGSGHVMRCMALALRLRADGYEVHLVSAELPPSLRGWLEAHGLAFTVIPAVGAWNASDDAVRVAEVIEALGDVALVVVDHYDLDAHWEAALRPLVQRIWAIDDLANRAHDCDVLIDPGLHTDAEHRYDGLVPTRATQLLGPNFALLRPEFDFPTAGPHHGLVSSLLVYLGGGEQVGREIDKILSAVAAAGLPQVATTVLLGPLAEAADLRARLSAAHPDAAVLETADSMADLMLGADLSIGTCGAANWERCAVGLPALTVLTAENQRDDAEQLHERGVVRHLGDAADVSEADWVEALQWAATHPQALRDMADRGRALVPGWTEARAAIEGLLPHVG